MNLPKVVVAIDFGTSRTGYRFAFTSVPNEVYGDQAWPDAPEFETKTLTELLLKRTSLQSHLDMKPGISLLP